MEGGFGHFTHLRESRTHSWSSSSLGLTQNTQAGLLSAIVTSFLIAALSDLGPDYQQQSALLLYQILNGHDPNLASISDPTALFKPSNSAIAVNCLWSASLSASLGASFGAMICREWLAEYTGGANQPLDLLRACQRQTRFRVFSNWNVDTLIALLPALLYSSALLFFTGAALHLWKIDVRVATVYLTIGGISGITYFISIFLPFVADAPFRPHSMLLIHRLSVAIGRIIIPIVDAVRYACFLALRYVTGAILWPFAQNIFSKGALQTWYMQAREILPGEYNHMLVWWANSFSGSLDEIDTSQRTQEEAILWLSQMPLDKTESKAVVSSLALISSSRPHRFSESVVVFLNSALESSYREPPSQAQAEVAIDCIIALGRIKYQSVVDRNCDQDHEVGGVRVTPLVGWAAQQLTANAFDKNFNTPHSEGIRARLLTAAAWLSPVDATEATLDGEKLMIQDRWEFVEELRMTLGRQVCADDPPIDNKVLINLINGMHACIPRGDYGSASSIVSFLPSICDDYDSSWSEDESVLRALITYALDLLLPSNMRKPLVEREIEFDKLASELIDALLVDTTFPDVVAFGFWLIYRVPYAFKSRKSILSDIVYIWTSTNEAIPEDLRQRMNFHAVDAFVAVALYHNSLNRRLSKFAAHNTLNLLNVALEDGYTRPMATYAVAMILDLGTSTQAASFTRGVDAESLTKTLHTVRDDLEKNVVEEDIVDLHVYSTLVLLKLPQPPVDVEKVKALIDEMERTIGDPVFRDSGLARGPKAEANVDLDRVKWKAIYLCGLLSRLLPLGEREGTIERVRERVMTLLRSGELLLAGDYERCIEPLDIDSLDVRTPAEQGGLMYTVFEGWIRGFPCIPLAGSVSAKNFW